MPTNMPTNKKKRTVLIVEDNELNREVLEDILSSSYNVIQAENGMVGMTMLDKYGISISLILLDIQMPVMNGYEFLAAMHEKPNFAGIPVIVTTSSESDSDEIRCLESGASDFLTKPYNPEVVLSRVTSAIRLRESLLMLSKVEFDTVTGLYNTAFFYDKASEILEGYPGEQFDIVCIEVESYKTVSDRHGANKGNELLRFAADKLQSFISPNSICGRISGDILAVICPHADFEEHLRYAETFSKMLADFSVPNITVRFGVDCNISRSAPISESCDNALIAIADVRSHRYTKVALYNETVRQNVKREQLITEQMDKALQEHQIQVYYQPKHDLKTGRISGAEALVRWIHPELGFLSPGEFIPLFEKNGFITKLDSYVMKETCSHLREWLDKGLTVVPVSVNVSRIDFENSKLAEHVINIVEHYGLPRELIHIEITETAYIDNPEQIVLTVGELKAANFSVEMDDFGSGYSSLNVLSELLPDILKLDMSIVQNMGSETQQVIVSSVLNMAKILKMDTVAEGIETAEQAETLKQMGCTYAQGYYYSKPLPREQFEQYLKKEFLE